jgi:hypothetical protein
MGVICVRNKQTNQNENQSMSPMKGAAPLNTIQTKMGTFFS